MSSKQAEPRSIASQFVLLFTLAAAFLLCCGLGALYWIVVRHAFEEDNGSSRPVAAVQADLTRPVDRGSCRGEERPTGERAACWVRVLVLQSHGGGTPGMARILPTAVFPAAPTTDFKRRDFHCRPALLPRHQRTHCRSRPILIQVAQTAPPMKELHGQFAALLAVVLALGVAASTIIAWTVAARVWPIRQMTRP
jgi:hypothetical protein